MSDTMTEITLDAPALLTFSNEEMGGEGAKERCSERDARLLEAGDYPDKGLRLTEDDLDGIVARFSGGSPPVPVKVEHVDSPLDPLGHVRRVWRDGSALLGTLAFPDDLAAFLRRRGAAKLSVGLARTPLALQEVSLVLKPRVAGAVLMTAPTPGPKEAPTPGPSPASGRGESEREFLRPSPGTGEGPGVGSEIVRLRAELTRRDVDAQVAAFKAQGRIVPASEAPARALLAAAGEASVTLSEGPEPICAGLSPLLGSAAAGRLIWRGRYHGWRGGVRVHTGRTYVPIKAPGRGPGPGSRADPRGAGAGEEGRKPCTLTRKH
jgi:hypothetical protein